MGPQYGSDRADGTSCDLSVALIGLSVTPYFSPTPLIPCFTPPGGGDWLEYRGQLDRAGRI